jgi:hypothetical protein
MFFIGLDTTSKMVIIRDDSTRMQLLLTPLQAKDLAKQIISVAEHCEQILLVDAAKRSKFDANSKE